MKKHFLLALGLCIFNLLTADATSSPIDLTPYNHRLVGTYEFEGDSYADFKGDTVVVLDDLSHWKVHPNHSEQFEQWKSGETVHAAMRTSYYFFKREHKFALINHERHEEVHVMLIQSPLIIYEIGQPRPTSCKCKYAVSIALSDMSEWIIEAFKSEISDEGRDKYFAIGSPAYVGYNLEEDKVSFIVINGVEREARWRWAEKRS